MPTCQGWMKVKASLKSSRSMNISSWGNLYLTYFAFRWQHLNSVLFKSCIVSWPEEEKSLLQVELGSLALKKTLKQRSISFLGNNQGLILKQTNPEPGCFFDVDKEVTSKMCSLWYPCSISLYYEIIWSSVVSINQKIRYSRTAWHFFSLSLTFFSRWKNMDGSSLMCREGLFC